MENNTFVKEFLAELKAEAPATRKCLERIPESVFEYKPHEKSMKMGYLTLLVAEVPKWITAMLEQGEIDFSTFKHSDPKTTAEMVAHFDENLEKITKLLENSTDEIFTGLFTLKNKDQIFMSIPKKESVSSSIRHWVHHRGQLTVYMRLNNIAVPPIYGPTADEREF